MLGFELIDITMVIAAIVPTVLYFGGNVLRVPRGKSNVFLIAWLLALTGYGLWLLGCPNAQLGHFLVVLLPWVVCGTLQIAWDMTHPLRPTVGGGGRH